MEVQVTGRGEVAEEAKRFARAELADLERYLKKPVMGARVVLTQEENPRIPLPARAEGEVLLGGRPVRARAAAPAMDAAIREMGERLQRQLRRSVERMVTRQREPAQSPPGEWRHGSLPAARRPRSFRPPGERRLVRRKAFALEPEDAARAAEAMEALDHDFYLYTDAEIGTDALLYRRDDGALSVIEPVDRPRSAKGEVPRENSRFSEPIEVATSVREMDELDHRFLFFTNAETQRGNVIYLRYDGHYGLIEPVAATG